jgi:hypothetical protein
VNDSIKYGPLLGVCLFIGKVILFSWFLETWDSLRSLLINAVGLFVALHYIAGRNKSHFPFKVVWLTGFNIVVVASIISALLVFGLNSFLFKDELNSMQALYYAFTEFLTAEFAGVVVVTILSLLMKKENGKAQ